MPIYDYRCTACDHLAEVIHGIFDEGPRFCPACGAEGTLRKGVVTAAVLFKGSGWARKDRSPGGSSHRPAADGGSDGSKDGPDRDANRRDEAEAAKPATDAATTAESSSAPGAGPRSGESGGAPSGSGSGD